VLARSKAIVVLCAIVSCAASQPARSQPFEIGIRKSFATGADPWVVVFGDINADGNTDFATANENANSVSVWIGNGFGGFAPRVDYATGRSRSRWRSPTSAATARSTSWLATAAATRFRSSWATQRHVRREEEFRDGAGPVRDRGGRRQRRRASRPRARQPDGGFRVRLLGSGGGAFYGAITYPTNPNAVSVALGDLNGDGYLDIISVSATAAKASVLLGNGLGWFGAKTDFSTGLNPKGAAVGDLNGDGKLDLAVANNDGASVAVLLGNGVGGFAAKTDFTTDAGPYSVVIADLDRDGRPDLATANVDVSTVSVLIGNGGGGFAPRTDFVVDDPPIAIAAGDLKWRRHSRPCGRVEFDQHRLVAPRGRQRRLRAPKDFPAGDGPITLALGQLNADARPDVAVGNVFTNDISVFSTMEPVACWRRRTISRVRAPTASRSETSTAAVPISSPRTRWPPAPRCCSGMAPAASGRRPTSPPAPARMRLPWAT
jgi:hypothetical protein